MFLTQNITAMRILRTRQYQFRRGFQTTIPSCNFRGEVCIYQGTATPRKQAYPSLRQRIRLKDSNLGSGGWRRKTGHQTPGLQFWKWKWRGGQTAETLIYCHNKYPSAPAPFIHTFVHYFFDLILHFQRTWCTSHR